MAARHVLIFVEGTADSLDARLYRLLFPAATVCPANGRPQVEAAVRALATVEASTWVNVRGIVDGDRTTRPDRERLRGSHVHALGCRAVESLYYHPLVQRQIAASRYGRAGGDLEAHLACAAETTVRVHADLALHLRTNRPAGLSDIDFAEAIIARVAIKETAIPGQVAHALGFRSRREYEGSVLDRVGGCEAFGPKIVGLDEGLAGLAADLGSVRLG